MKSLPIVWQRLVSPDGKTCDRRSATYQEMQQAVSNLKETLRPLSIEPTLEVREIDQESFDTNSCESNRIWIPEKLFLRAALIASAQLLDVAPEDQSR